MSMRLYQDALRQFVKMGGTRISFNPLVGEPLLDPLIFERLKLAVHCQGVKQIDLFTNAIALERDENFRRLLDTGIATVNISTGGFKREVYNKAMGVERYDEALNGVKLLLEENAKRGKKTRIELHIRGRMSSWLTKDFVDQILPLVDDDFIMNNVHTTKMYDNWGGLVKKIDLPQGSGFYPRGRLRRRPCNRMFEAAVLWNGDIRACDCRFGEKGKHDELVIGNLEKATLEAIWHGPKIMSLRRAFGRKGGAGVCRNCNVYNPIHS